MTVVAIGNRRESGVLFLEEGLSGQPVGGETGRGREYGRGDRQRGRDFKKGDRQRVGNET